MSEQPKVNKTSDEAVLKIKEKILNNAQRKEAMAWEFVLSTEQGRRVLWDLMMKFGLFDYTFNTNGSTMAEKAARQGCAQHIRNMVSFWVGGQCWALMESEDMARKTTDLAETERLVTELEKRKKPNNG